MKLGENELGKVFVGNGFVEKMYQGDTEVYSIYKDPKAAEFTYRRTDNGEQVSVPDPYFGKALIDSIKGKTLVWNQIMKEISSANYAATGNFSINNGVITIVGRTLSSGLGYYEANNIIGSTHDFIAGHKYYIGITCTNYNITVGAATNIRFILGAAANRVGVFVRITGVGRFANIMTCTNPYSVRSYGYAGTQPDETVAPEDTFSVKDLVLFDLTKMFGSGYEPSTVDEFRALFPLPYYSYNAGTLINNAATALETVGFNQWDEVWELGSISPTGGNSSSSIQIRSKNYVPVFPSTQYYFYSGSAVIGRVCYYDANKNFVSVAYPTENTIITTPAGAYFMRFVMGKGTPAVTTYNHDICINRSDASRNGIYEPYWKRDIVLGLDNIPCHDENNNAVVVNGLDGVGTAQDELIVENGWGKKINKNRARVDLGDLTWTKSTSGGYDFFFSSVVSEMKQTYSGVANLICQKYTTSDAQAAGLFSKDKQIGENGGRLYVYDTALSGGDAAAFKAAMAGVILDYPLATPKEYELVDPITPYVEVDKNGTEKILPENSSEPTTAPFSGMIGYCK